MPKRDRWQRSELLIALKLYCELPFGKMHSRNPEIQRFAEILGRTPSSLAMKLTNFASLDPQITATGRRGLSGASKADRDLWKEMTSNWPRLADEISEVQSTFPELGREAKPERADRDFTGNTRSTLTESRIGQDFFRRAVLSAYEFSCCITGLRVPALLIASHIVPWRDDSANRLNPRNGLCLSAIHDRAFDQGFIAISEDFRLLLSPRIRKLKANLFLESTFCSYEGKPIKLPKKFNPDPAFLSHHRERLFKK